MECWVKVFIGAIIGILFVMVVNPEAKEMKRYFKSWLHGTPNDLRVLRYIVEWDLMVSGWGVRQSRGDFFVTLQFRCMCYIKGEQYVVTEPLVTPLGWDFEFRAIEEVKHKFVTSDEFKGQRESMLKDLMDYVNSK